MIRRAGRRPEVSRAIHGHGEGWHLNHYGDGLAGELHNNRRWITPAYVKSHQCNQKFNNRPIIFLVLVDEADIVDQVGGSTTVRYDFDGRRAATVFPWNLEIAYRRSNCGSFYSCTSVSDTATHSEATYREKSIQKQIYQTICKPTDCHQACQTGSRKEGRERILKTSTRGADIVTSGRRDRI